MDAKDFREFLTKISLYTACNACMVLGHRVGLFNILCGQNEPITTVDLAEKCKVKTRILVEWIEVLVSAKVLSKEEETERCYLTEEIKEVLKEQQTTIVFKFCEDMLSLGARQKNFIKIFKEDGPEGLPVADTPESFDAQNKDSFVTFRNIFENCIFQRVDGLQEKLDSGVEVLDVCCGGGGLLRILAERFPEGRYIGVDYIDSSIDYANKELVTCGLTNCMFDVQDATNLPKEWTRRFDVVYLHDAFHSLSHPRQTANELFRVVKEGGVVLLFDPNLKPGSELSRTYSPVFTASNMYYCLTGDIGARSATPIGCVRTGDAMEKILNAVFPSVNVIRVSDMFLLHVCVK